MKICHIISSLEVGGAQKILVQVCERLQGHDLQFIIISLTRETKLADQLRAAGCTVYCLNVNGWCSLVSGFWKMLRILRRERPEIVQTWLYHADLLGTIAARLTGLRHIVWTTHHANANFQREGRATRLLVRLLANASKWAPENIVYCSPAAQQVHEDLGFDKRRGAVILNGIDEEAFRPDQDLRLSFRRELGVDDGAKLVGIVGRYSPLKGHDVFLEMAEIVAKSSAAPVAFVMAGTGVTPQNKALVSSIAQHGLAQMCHLLGERDDVAALMNGLDTLVCPSYSESFGLVLVEAIACGTPAIASDLDATSIILGPDWLVPVGDAPAFAAKVSACLEAKRDQFQSEQLRELVTRRFGLAPMIAQYRNLYNRACHAQ